MLSFKFVMSTWKLLLRGLLIKKEEYDFNSFYFSILLILIFLINFKRVQLIVIYCVVLSFTFSIFRLFGSTMKGSLLNLEEVFFLNEISILAFDKLEILSHRLFEFSTLVSAALRHPAWCKEHLVYLSRRREKRATKNPRSNSLATNFICACERCRNCLAS